MATWQAIEHASLTLKRLLEQHIAMTLPTSNVVVELATTQGFTDMQHVNRPTITLFLYRCMENPELRNAPQRRRSDGSLVRQPQVLELCYLVTPWSVRGGSTNANDATATQEEHRLLGLISQCFYDHAEVGRSELFETPARPVWNATDTMQIVMDSLPVEDHYRIWDANELAYRLSVTYRARIIGIESSVVQGNVPVVDASFQLVKP